MVTLIISKLFNHFLLPPGIFFLLLVIGIIFYFLRKARVLIYIAVASGLLIYLLSTEPVKDLLLLQLENYAKKTGILLSELDAGDVVRNISDSGVSESRNDIFNSGISESRNNSEFFVNRNDSEFSRENKESLKEPLSGRNRMNNYTVKDYKADCIILLGGGIYEESPDYSGKASPSPDAVKRAVYAYLTYKKTGLPIITTGGKSLGLKGSTPEGEALGYLLEKLGVPQDKILPENSSKNTYENVLFAKNIMAQYGWKKAYVITSAYHMKRAMWVCKKHGVNALPIPTDFKMEKGWYNFESFLPGSTTLADSGKALHEYFGLVYYRIVY